MPHFGLERYRKIIYCREMVMQPRHYLIPLALFIIVAFSHVTHAGSNQRLCGLVVADDNRHLESAAACNLNRGVPVVER